ncbi:MAG: ABC transporter permease [Bacteroidota bacterium]
MRTFLAFIKKEFKHIFRDKRTLVILFGMPIAQVLLFGFAITTEIKDGKMAILDLAKNSVSQGYINKITSSGYFIVQENLKTYNDIEESFKKGTIKIALVIPQNFAKDLGSAKSSTVQIIADATDPNMGNILTGYLSGVTNSYSIEKKLINKTPVVIESKMLYNPESKSVFMFVPGVMTIILMLVSAMMTSITVAKEKELGTMEILLVSPLKPGIIIIGKVIPYIALSLVNAATILALGFAVFGMPLNGSFIFLSLEILLFIITALGLGVLISTISNSQQTAMLISLMGLMLPTILLSGFIFPIESMPEILQVISNVIPAKWFIIIIKSIMLKGLGITALWKETLILLFMTIFFIVMSIKRFKIRLE